jgi:hypothetical protein
MSVEHPEISGETRFNEGGWSGTFLQEFAFRRLQLVVSAVRTHRDRSCQKLRGIAQGCENSSSPGTRPWRQWCFEPDC